MALAIADYWQRAGVGVEMNFVPRQRQPDIEYRALRPAFHFAGGNSDFEGLKTMHSAEIPRPQTSWRGTNHSRYVSPEYDALYDRFVSTIPKVERLQALGQVLLHIAVELPVLPVYYRVDPTIVHNRLLNVGPRKRLSTQAWNSHEWDVR
jgi:peptide/nickel transport system substrate-binding protein